jgi:outer membrane murein-binding lipoprotein Lpp
MEIILQEKNKRIEELERMVQEKAEEVKAAHEEVKRILYEKN